MFRGWHAKATGAFVIEADGGTAQRHDLPHYRAQRISMR